MAKKVRKKTKTGVTLNMAKSSEARAIRTEIQAPSAVLDSKVSGPPESKMDDDTLIEREIRRYIRKRGGFRKNLADADKKHAKKLLKLAGRPDELEWNTDIVVPGVDNPSVSNIIYKDAKKNA